MFLHCFCSAFLPLPAPCPERDNSPTLGNTKLAVARLCVIGMQLVQSLFSAQIAQAVATSSSSNLQSPPTPLAHATNLLPSSRSTADVSDLLRHHWQLRESKSTRNSRQAYLKLLSPCASSRLTSASTFSLCKLAATSQLTLV